MQPYEQIIEDILTILTADVDPSDDALRDVDTRYAEAVIEVNERLTNCDRLLHKGHRAEAIQECDRSPSLLDAVAVLDFPEAAQWGEYVRQFGLAGPPALRADIAMDLNDAYTTNSELGDVLCQHRLLALARAPLGARLKILRLIARQDAGNPVWVEDVRTWEHVRHGQLASEAEQAVARNDLAAICQLEQEVRGESWLVPPPGGLNKRIADAHGLLRAKQARQQLEALEKDLTEAYADFDVQRARKIRQQWQVYAAVGITRDSDPLLELVTPALQWLAEQDRLEQEQQDYEEALADIRSALDDRAPRHELERLAHAVMHFEPGLPAALEQRLRDRFEGFEKASRRRTAFILTGIVMSVLLIAGVTAWGIHAYARANRLTGHQKNLAQLIEARRLPEAQSYADELQENEPSLFQSPEIQDQVKALETATQAEQSRRDRFDQLVRDAAIDGQTWAGYSDAWRKLRDADELIEKAPSHLQDAEKKELEVVRGEVENTRRRLQTEINETWLTDFRVWDQQREQLDRTNLDEIQRLLNEGEVLAKRPHVESVHRDQIRPRLEDLKKAYEVAMRNQNESQLLQRVIEALGDRAKYQRSLQSYIDKFPSGTRATDFKQVLEQEANWWDGIEQWDQLTAGWSQLRLNSLTPVRAAELTEQADNLLEQHPGFPAAAAVKKMLEYIRPIQARIQRDGKRLDASLIPDLSVPVVTDFLMVRQKPPGGTPVRYYFTGEAPKVFSRRLRLAHLVDNQSGETRQTEIPSDQVLNPPQGNTFDWASPQQQFFDFLADQLPQLNDANWEATFFEIIQQLFNEPLMDPILKIELLERILATACEGSYAVQQGFGPWKDLIQRAKQDGRVDLAVNWVDPQNANAARARDAAQRLLDSMAPLEVATIRARSAWKEMNLRPTWQRYRWVGCLTRSDSWQWTCSISGGANNLTGDLYVIHGGANATTPVFTMIGNLSHGRATLMSKSGQVEGRPVFVRESF